MFGSYIVLYSFYIYIYIYIWLKISEVKNISMNRIRGSEKQTQLDRNQQ